MIVNFSWVIEARLAGFGLLAPLTDSDLLALGQQGIDTVISLTEEPAEIADGSDMRYLHLPIADMHAPSLQDIEQFVQFVDAGQACAVHCRAGLGRTGTMLACYLIHQGTDWEDAIVQVRQHRPGSVETQAQEQVIREFSEARASVRQRA